MLKDKLISFFSIKNNKKTVLVSFVITFAICFVSYSAFIVYGFSSPDGILEGLHFYTNKEWAIAGCGRWFLALLNILHANIVMPWLIIIECTIVNWLSAHTICKIFKIENRLYYFLICAIFAVLPTFIEMYTYTNSVFSYCVSVLFSILFVYFNLFNNKYLSILSAVLLGCAMGSYQSQIGIAVGLTIMCLIYKILNKENDKLKFFVFSLISGLLGIVVYIVGLELFLKIYNLKLFSRASTFSFVDIFTHFIPRFIYSYEVFFNTFNQLTLKRYLVYIIVFIVFIVEIVFIAYNQFKNKNYLSACLFVLLIILLPPALNIIGIILPTQSITSMMLSPNYIIIPFIFCISGFVTTKISKLFNVILGVCVLVLSWTYILSANATYDSYRLSYNVYKTQFSNAMDAVYKLDDYRMNSTRIIVIGNPSDEELRGSVQNYNYAINLYDNLLYWGTPELDPRASSIYITNEFGINPGVMEYDEYYQFINLQECQEMPCWPYEGSVKMVNDCAVIKFSEVYD